MMQRRKSCEFALLSLSMLLLVGCPTSQPPQNASISTTVPGLATDLDALISSRGSLTFRAWSGKWIGTDCDTDITFLAGGKAHLTQYGFAVTSFDGTYTVGVGGEVAARFPSLEEAWPGMMLRKDGISLFLTPTEKQLVGTFSNEANDPELAEAFKNYWPFRPVSLDQERVVQQQIIEWK